MTAPETPPRARTGALAPLNHPVFRAVWITSLATNFGGLIQSVGAAWMISGGVARSSGGITGYSPADNYIGKVVNVTAPGVADVERTGYGIAAFYTMSKRTKLYGGLLDGDVGLGRIGAEVSKRALAFGMKVLAYDPYLTEARAKALGVSIATLDEVFALSDYITVHMPLIEKGKQGATEGMVDAAAFAKMKKGVKIVNCARGGIVDDAAHGGRVEQVKIDEMARTSNSYGGLGRSRLRRTPLRHGKVLSKVCLLPR